MSINEKAKASIEKWRKNNPEKDFLYRRKWTKEHPEEHRLKVKAWRIANPGRTKARYDKWRLNNPGRYAALQAKRRAIKLKATPPWLTPEHYKQIDVFYIEAARLTKDTGVKYSVDHIWPLQGIGFTGLHVPWNLRVMLFTENSGKSNSCPKI